MQHDTQFAQSRRNDDGNCIGLVLAYGVRHEPPIFDGFRSAETVGTSVAVLEVRAWVAEVVCVVGQKGLHEAAGRLSTAIVLHVGIVELCHNPSNTGAGHGRTRNTAVVVRGEAGVDIGSQGSDVGFDAAVVGGATAGRVGYEVRSSYVGGGNDVLALLVTARDVAPAASRTVVAVCRAVVAGGKDVRQGVVLDGVFVHLAREGRVARVAAIGVGRCRNPNVVGGIVRIDVVQVVGVVVVDQMRSGRLTFAIGIQVARTKNGSCNVVAMGPKGGAGFISGDAALEVNVHFNVAVVPVAHHHTRAVIVAAACVGYAQGAGAVVLSTNAVFRLCRCFFLLHQGDVGMAG